MRFIPLMTSPPTRLQASPSGPASALAPLETIGYIFSLFGSLVTGAFHGVASGATGGGSLPAPAPPSSPLVAAGPAGPLLCPVQRTQCGVVPSSAFSSPALALPVAPPPPAALASAPPALREAGRISAAVRRGKAGAAAVHPSSAHATGAAAAALGTARAGLATALAGAVQPEQHRRRAAAVDNLSAFLRSLPRDAAQEVSVLEAVLLYLNRRRTTGGRQGGLMALSTLRNEVGSLRALARREFGDVVWDPVTARGNPLLAPEIELLLQSHAQTAASAGLVPSPAVEACPLEVATLVTTWRDAASRVEPGSVAEIRARQLVFAVLACTLWGDRANDVVRYDFEDIRLLRSPREVAAAWPAQQVLDVSGEMMACPLRGAWVLVRRRHDKGSKLMAHRGNLSAAVRYTAYPLLEDVDMCPAVALAELAAAYRSRYGESTDVAPTGPVLRALLYSTGAGSPLERVKENTFGTRFRDALRSAHGGRFSQLTSHSFRRGFAQWMKLAGASSDTILEHFRWRQIETARLYFRRARPEGEVAEPTAAQQASLARPLRELTEQTRRAALGVAGHRVSAPPAASPAPARAHVAPVPPASPGVGRLLLDDGGAAFEAAAVAAADAAEAAVACGFHTPRRLAVHGGGEDAEASFDQAAVAATLAAEQRASARGAAVARLEAFRFLDDPRPSSRM